MPTDNKKQTTDENKEEKVSKKDKGKKNQNKLLQQLMGRLSMRTYGTTGADQSQTDTMNTLFHSILQKNETEITNGNAEDITSFVSKLFHQDRRNNIYNNANGTEDPMSNMFADTGINFDMVNNMMTDKFKNRFIKQSNIHDISSMLIELKEAMNATRDSILGADTTTGDVNRILHFKNLDDDEAAKAREVIEKMEGRFELPKKIKSFVVPKGLEYGDYYAYAIPYKKIFHDFLRAKEAEATTGNQTMTGRLNNPYHESTLYDLVHDKSRVKDYKKSFDLFCEETYDELSSNIPEDDRSKTRVKTQLKKELQEAVDDLMGRVTISNDMVPLCYLEEGAEAMQEYMESFVSESGEYKEEKVYQEESQSWQKANLFKDVHKKQTEHDVSSEGLISDKGRNPFEDIKDIYQKMVDPLHMIPLEIMDEQVGYYHIVDTELNPMDIQTSGGMMDGYNLSDEYNTSIVDFLATQIVDSFDKKWLKKNIKFKKLIVNALQYFNLNQRKIRFQYIPAEYVFHFPVNVDENGEGRSMLEPSLFYANLYMLLLMFYIMSTVQYSNDTKVNYLKQSSIDKDTASKIDEITRKKQARNINLLDMFSYSTVLNKVANGNEIYYPTGRSGDRAIETEVISGQQIQMNNELMELLRKCYILGTGVPSAIINYLDEADFSRSVQLANRKYGDLVVSLQLEENKNITAWYQGLLRMSTDLEERIIQAFSYELPQSKSSNDNAINDLLNNYNTRYEAIKKLLFGEEMNDADKVVERAFAMNYAREYAPVLEIDRAMEILKDSKLDALDNTLAPKTINDEEDMDLSAEDLGL